MIIGIAGKARSGKDTVGSYLSRKKGFKQTSFAESLKEAVKIIYGWNDQHVYGKLKEEVDPFWGVSPRYVMQKFGTEACREVMQKDIWIKSLERRIQSEPNKNWVITDCRFINEIGFVKNMGGVLLKVVRNNREDIDNKGINHSSENSLDNFNTWDAVIENNGTYRDLYLSIEHLFDTKFNDIVIE